MFERVTSATFPVWSPHSDTCLTTLFYCIGIEECRAASSWLRKETVDNICSTGCHLATYWVNAHFHGWLELGRHLVAEDLVVHQIRRPGCCLLGEVLLRVLRITRTCSVASITRSCTLLPVLYVAVTSVLVSQSCVLAS